MQSRNDDEAARRTRDAMMTLYGALLRCVEPRTLQDVLRLFDVAARAIRDERFYARASEVVS